MHTFIDFIIHVFIEILTINGSVLNNWMHPQKTKHLQHWIKKPSTCNIGSSICIMWMSLTVYLYFVYLCNCEFLFGILRICVIVNIYIWYFAYLCNCEFLYLVFCVFVYLSNWTPALTWPLCLWLLTVVRIYLWCSQTPPTQILPHTLHNHT